MIRHMKNVNADKIKLTAAMTIFGTIGLLVRYIPYPSGVIALARGAIGTLFLLVVRLFGKEKLSSSAIKKNMPLLLLSGVLIGANWICLFEAYRHTTVSVATMCYYMSPVFVTLVSPLVLRERLTLKKGLCAFAAAAGMALVSGIFEAGALNITGILLGLAAAGMYAAVIIINKFISGVSAADRTIFQLGTATLALLPYALLTQDISALEATPLALALLLVAGILHTGVAYTLYFSSMKGLPAQTVALFSYIDPVVAVLLSVWVLHELLSPFAVVGIVLVLGATVISEVRVRFKKKEGSE